MFPNPTVVITGTSTQSLGAQTALELSKANPPPRRLILLARSQSKVQPVIDAIKAINPSIEATFIGISLDDLSSVRQAADDVLSALGEDKRIDVLINNAGIMAVPYSKTVDGVERQFATNHLGHFLLTKLLFDPAIRAAGDGARIVNLSSAGYQMCPFRGAEGYNFGDGEVYDEWSGYGQSKTANILFTKGLAARGVLSYAVQPGTIFGTGLADHFDPVLFEKCNGVALRNTGASFTIDEPKTIEQGVSTTIVAVIDPGLVPHSGSYLDDCQVREVTREYARDPKMVQELWDLSERLTAETFEI